MAEYYTILTDAGRALEVAALAGQSDYTLETCVLGDGTAMPDPARTSIQNEVWRGPINTIAPDFNNPTWLVIEARVPPEDGGFIIREFGIYTDGGILFAIGNYPETYKPVISEGTGVDLVVRPICEVSNAASVTLLTDPSVMMASKSYVDEQIKKVPRRNVGDVYFHQGRSAPFGAVVADGGLVQRDLYPDLWAFAQAQNLVITESAWQTQSTSQGSVGVYSSGDGSTTFRLPLMTDYFRGTVDPAKVGTWQGDAIRDIVGQQYGLFAFSTSGAFGSVTTSAKAYPNVGTNSSWVEGSAQFKASNVVPTASENRPKTLFLLPCIHAYNSVIPDAQADMHGYLAALNGKVDKTAWQTLVEDKAWKLPNGQIIQLFTTSSNLPANSDTAVTAVFPVTFPNKCLQIVPGLQSSAPRTFSVSWHTITNANVKVFYGNAGATAMTGAVVSIMAIGM